MSGWSFKEALTLRLLQVQGQHLRASASLNAVPWAPGWLHPTPRSAVRVVYKYPRMIGVRRGFPGLGTVPCHTARKEEAGARSLWF